MTYNLIIGLDKGNDRMLKFDNMVESYLEIISWRKDKEYDITKVKFINSNLYVCTDQENANRAILYLKKANIRFLGPETIEKIVFYCKENIVNIETFVFEEYDGNVKTDIIDFSDKIRTVVSWKQLGREIKYERKDW